MGKEAEFRPRSYLLTRSEDRLEHLPLAGTAESAAAKGLMILMSALSEQCFAASWSVNLEYELWQYRQEGPSVGGFLPARHRITDRQCALLRLLSEECDGWWMYPLPVTGDDPLQFVSLARWEEHIGRVWVHRGGFLEHR